MIVTAVEAKGDKAAILVMDNGQRVWTPEKAKADELVGKPIPGDWTQKEGDYGPQAFPPREKKGFGGGGAAAFRNTKEGQAIEQERMDRRTALMQAVAGLGISWGAELPPSALTLADIFYEWLRATSGTPAASNQPASSTTKVGQGAAAGSERESGNGVPRGEAVAPDSCSHPSYKRVNGVTVCAKCGKPR